MHSPLLQDATKLYPDPLCVDKRFFVYSSSTKTIHTVQVDHGTFYHVDDFGVSSSYSYILYVSGGKSSVYERRDSAITPILETAVRQGAKVYVDDEYYYELLGTKVFVLSIGNGPVQLVRNVSNVFKSQGVVIQYTYGAIATVRAEL